MVNEKTVAAEFDRLTLNLQRAVEDMDREASTTQGKTPHVAIPLDVYSEVKLALHAIHDYAQSIVVAARPKYQGCPCGGTVVTDDTDGMQVCCSCGERTQK